MECAGAVDSTTVRSPAWAQLRAVAAAVVVLPTPPLPVKSRTLVTRRARSRLHVVPQLAQRGVDDLALGAALDEPGEGHDQLDVEVVGDEGSVAVAGHRGEHVGTVEATHDVAAQQLPVEPGAVVGVGVSEGGAGAAPRGDRKRGGEGKRG